jgi:AcrR family transcriptional regulator
MFAEHGVDGVAVRDLARELELTPSSLYNHFAGKQALYERSSSGDSIRLRSSSPIPIRARSRPRRCAGR